MRLSEEHIVNDTMDIVECAFDILTNEDLSPGETTEWLAVVDDVCARGSAAEAILALQAVAESNEYKQRHLLFDRMHACLNRVDNRVERRLALMADIADTIVLSLKTQARVSGSEITAVSAFVDDFSRPLQADDGGGCTEEQRRRQNNVVLTLLAEVAAILVNSCIDARLLGPVAPVRPFRKSRVPSNRPPGGAGEDNAAVGKLWTLKTLGDSCRRMIVCDTEFADNATCSVENGRSDLASPFAALLLCRELFRLQRPPGEEDGRSEDSSVESTAAFERCMPIIEMLCYDVNCDLFTKGNTTITAYIIIMLLLNRCESASIQSLCYHFLNKHSLTQFVLHDASSAISDVQCASCETLLVLFDRLSSECRLDFLGNALQLRPSSSALRALAVDLIRAETHANFARTPFSLHGDDDDVETLANGRRRKCLKNLIEGHILCKAPPESADLAGNPLPLDGVVHASLTLLRYISTSARSGDGRGDAFRGFIDFRRAQNGYMNLVGNACDAHMKGINRNLAAVDAERREKRFTRCDEARKTHYLALKNELIVTCEMYNIAKLRTAEVLSDIKRRRTIN